MSQHHAKRKGRVHQERSIRVHEGRPVIPRAFKARASYGFLVGAAWERIESGLPPSAPHTSVAWRVGEEPLPLDEFHPGLAGADDVALALADGEMVRLGRVTPEVDGETAGEGVAAPVSAPRTPPKAYRPRWPPPALRVNNRLSAYT
jgi:hypothetical protein